MGITGFIGPNGAGKTTLLNIVSGIAKPDSGRVVFDGIDITGRSSSGLAALGLTRTFQIARELGSLTVFENLMLAPLKQSGERLFPAIFKRRLVREEEHEAALKARRILERINLWKLADAPASSLSGGQKKLLELGRAVMQEPRLILLDEPAAGVAPPLVLELMNLIRELSAQGIAFGIVEHDMRLIGALCDHVYVLAEGRTLVEGTFEAVTGDSRVIDAYLGQAA